MSRGLTDKAPISKPAANDPDLNEQMVACSPWAEPEVALHRDLHKQTRRGVRQAMFDRVRALRDAGHSVAAIMRETGFNRLTVAKWARFAVLPPRRITTPKPSSPAYCQAYLAGRWAEGFRVGRRLLPEIQRLGYTGSFSNLERLLTQWRD